MTMIKKDQIRKEILRRLKDQAFEERVSKSRCIAQRLLRMSLVKRARCILFYVATPEEVDTASMIDICLKLKKRVAVPKIRLGDKNIVPVLIRDRQYDLTSGVFGIREPKSITRKISPQEIDCVIVPGIAFDKKANRLGRGKGYYDLFLKQLKPEIPKIGLAFSLQMVKNLPTQDRDVSLSAVVTESQTIRPPKVKAV